MKRRDVGGPDWAVHLDTRAFIAENPGLWRIKCKTPAYSFLMQGHYYQTLQAANAAIEGMNHQYMFEAIQVQTSTLSRTEISEAHAVVQPVGIPK